MGDIIAGIFLIILTICLYGLYKVITRKTPEKRNFIGFILLLIFVGALIGILITCFNKRLLLEDYPSVFRMTLLFFTIQAAASYVYAKFPKVGLTILYLYYYCKHQ